MTDKKTRQLQVRKKFIIAFKIAFGSFLAIYIAELLQLEFAASAGIVTLLTIVSTKLDTFKLSLLRVVTFLAGVVLAWLLFEHIASEWLAFGLYIFVIVFGCQLSGLQNTISVNAVIGTHFMATHDFSGRMILNEFLIVAIGIAIAIIANLFQPYARQKTRIVNGIKEAEADMQRILEELAKYLRSHPFGRNVWEDIKDLERKLTYYVSEAYEYQDNTFVTHPEYYIWYFEMRMKQTHVLHNLHYELKKIREMPRRSEVVAGFMEDIKERVTEMHNPEDLLERLQETIEQIRWDGPVQNATEFESRARLYHIIMSLEEFLICKKEFVESLEERHLEIYWNKNTGKD